MNPINVRMILGPKSQQILGFFGRKIDFVTVCRYKQYVLRRRNVEFTQFLETQIRHIEGMGIPHFFLSCAKRYTSNTYYVMGNPHGV